MWRLELRFETKLEFAKVALWPRSQLILPNLGVNGYEKTESAFPPTRFDEIQVVRTNRNFGRSDSTFGCPHNRGQGMFPGIVEGWISSCGAKPVEPKDHRV